MKDIVALLGCAVDYLPVIFDVCCQSRGIRKFHIYKNIPVDSFPVMPVKIADYDIQYFEPAEPFSKDEKEILFGVNGPFAKNKVYEYFKDTFGIKISEYTSVVSTASILSPTVSYGNAAFIEPGCVISSQTRLGFGITVKRGVTIGHHCIVDDYVEINPGVTISGHVKIESGVIVGSGSVLRNGISIGKGSMIGMGSVVTKDIPPGVVAYGNPCKVVRKNLPREQEND